ncbi:mannosyl-oligosaccharide 1,2-alpha-mannosidase [Cladochytrium replicatum]|nr:mannosyl-oligosaccharide 1,2-alpha-mannosidase [Cladochytrium replicatum]
MFGGREDNGLPLYRSTSSTADPFGHGRYERYDNAKSRRRKGFFQILGGYLGTRLWVRILVVFAAAAMVLVFVYPSQRTTSVLETEKPRTTQPSKMDGSGAGSIKSAAPESPSQEDDDISSGDIWSKRRSKVVEAFRHAWAGYKSYAWGHDELAPVSKIGSDWLRLGLTAVDALDTALIMGQSDIYEDAKKWVEKGMKFEANIEANVFEITIRVLGGMLSAHHITNDPLFIRRAEELARLLLPAFTQSQTAIPLASINFAQGKGVASDWGFSSTAEATTLGMEFKYLSQVTGNATWWNLAQNAELHIVEMEKGKVETLVPIFVDPTNGNFGGGDIRLGSRGDSYYEYLAKQWLLTNETGFRDEFYSSLDGIKRYLLASSEPNGYAFIGELVAGDGHGHARSKPDPYKDAPEAHGYEFSPKMDHLVCFYPTALALAATRGKKVPLDAEERKKFMKAKDHRDLALAEDLTRGCIELYRQTPTGLAPEIAYWTVDSKAHSWDTLYDANKRPLKHFDNVTFLSKSEDLTIHEMDAHNLLRPETVESLFTLYRLTGDITYRNWGWEIFEAFEKWCIVPSGGYSSLDSVLKVPPPKRDKMESFFLGETLKYFYLLFSEETLYPLDKYVFNTEAHPLPVFQLQPTILKEVKFYDSRPSSAPTPAPP